MVITNQKSMVQTHTNTHTHTHTHTRNSNTTIQLVIKSQEKRKEKGKKMTYKNKPKTINKMVVRTHVLIIILNINIVMKRYRLAECTQK